MPSILLHPRVAADTTQIYDNNPLPPLLHTPSGLAILELQGTINLPTQEHGDDQNGDFDVESSSSATFETPIGKLMFPDYSPQDPVEDTKWMKRVYLYVGRYQRMTGEVKKLAMPLAVIQRRASTAPRQDQADHHDDGTEELEIAEIVQYKVLFKTRPEPVSDS